MLGKVSHVSDVAYGPFVWFKHLFFIVIIFWYCKYQTVSENISPPYYLVYYTFQKLQNTEAELFKEQRINQHLKEQVQMTQRLKEQVKKHNG